MAQLTFAGGVGPVSITGKYGFLSGSVSSLPTPFNPTSSYASLYFAASSATTSDTSVSFEAFATSATAASKTSAAFEDSTVISCSSGASTAGSSTGISVPVDSSGLPTTSCFHTATSEESSSSWETSPSNTQATLATSIHDSSMTTPLSSLPSSYPLMSGSGYMTGVIGTSTSYPKASLTGTASNPISTSAAPVISGSDYPGNCRFVAGSVFSSGSFTTVSGPSGRDLVGCWATATNNAASGTVPHNTPVGPTTYPGLGNQGPSQTLAFSNSGASLGIKFTDSALLLIVALVLLFN